ncbi:hypothetical protein BKA65DRAFT_493064 [Rhexocercosporidium sp. MPI-PUGE-AT-0058]|nr:hypothetical protein BKA65DRAFT_493064 [Rhexocercosporidium sp. MPI-PUGE-AT-0058]
MLMFTFKLRFLEQASERKDASARLTPVLRFSGPTASSSLATRSVTKPHPHRHQDHQHHHPRTPPLSTTRIAYPATSIQLRDSAKPHRQTNYAPSGTMADYSTQKVPDLKKLLSERGLVISGNKADLIARLQEDDSKKNGGASASGAGEDEIDWDEDDNKPAAEATTAPAAAAIAAGGVGQVPTPVAVPNQKAAIDPSTTSDLKVKQPEATAATPATDPTPAAQTEKPAETKPEEPKKDYTLGLGMSEAEKEAEKRAARAKRFARPEAAAAPAKELTEEEKKLEERAKKFGTDKTKEKEVVEDIVKGLNSALPERKLKRERGGEGQQGRQAKRQTPDRRTEGPRRGGGQQGQRGGGRGGERRAGGGGGAASGPRKVTDDPEERAKAEARAKRFAAAK